MLVYPPVLGGSTDISVICRAVDSTDGTPETAFDHATAGIDLKYRRELAANVDITEVALAALTTAHTDGGVEQIGNGYFRLDLPDAAVAAGVTGVVVHGTATGMVIIGCYVPITTATPVEVKADTAAILVDTGTTLDGKLNTIDDFLDTEIAAILADTGELQTDWANGGRLDLILDARASQLSVDTVDTVVDAVKVQTDKLTFTVANMVDSNVQVVNDVTVTGVGTEADPWGP